MSCPSCNEPLVGDDFGLTVCKSCGVSFFVNIDGSIMLAEPDAAPAKVSPAEITAEQTNDPVSADDFSMQADVLENPIEQNLVGEVIPENSFVAEALTDEPIVDKVISNESLVSAEVNSSEAPVVGNLEAEQSIAAQSVDSETSFYGPAPLPEPIHVDSPQSAVSPEDLSDISSFAENQSGVMSEGVLRYKVVITGFETKTIVEDFKFQISDKQFLWDPEQIVSTIKDGKLIIEDITPVKASVLLSRIMEMPLQVAWSQYALTMV